MKFNDISGIRASYILLKRSMSPTSITTVVINPNNADEILILGGNQDDEVNVTAYPLDQIVTINSLENIQEADTKLIEKISKDIKESGDTR